LDLNRIPKVLIEFESMNLEIFTFKVQFLKKKIVFFPRIMISRAYVSKIIVTNEKFVLFDQMQLRVVENMHTNFYKDWNIRRY